MPKHHVPAFLEFEDDQARRVEVGSQKWFLQKEGTGERGYCGRCRKHLRIYAMSRNVPHNCFRCKKCFLEEKEAAGNPLVGPFTMSADESPEPQVPVVVAKLREQRTDADRAADGEIEWDESEPTEPRDRFSAADMGIPEQKLWAAVACGNIALEKPVATMFELFGERYVVAGGGGHEFTLAKVSPIEDYQGKKYTYSERCDTRVRGANFYEGIIIKHRRKEYVLHGAASDITLFCPPINEGESNG